MAYQQNPPSIPMSAISWSKIGDESDPSARLLAHIRIAGLDMHLEAWAVTNENGMETAIPASHRTDAFESLSAMMDCVFETIEFEGRRYVLIATPYGA